MPRLFGAACFLDDGVTPEVPNRYRSESGHSHPRPAVGCVPALNLTAQRATASNSGAGSGFAWGDRDRFAGRSRGEGRPSAGVGTYQCLFSIFHFFSPPARTTSLRPTERICLVGRSLTLINSSRARKDTGSIPSTSHTFSKENGLWMPRSAWNHR